MSADEVSALREDIAELRAIIQERQANSLRNGKFLHGIAAAVAIQLVFTIFYAGAKTALLDRLMTDVHDIQLKLESR
jgi:hypothetical protein